MAAERLKDAQIERKDALVLLKEMNDKDTLVYADPPYLHETRVSNHYSNEVDTAYHIDLLDILKDYKGHVILSGYESKLYDEALIGWTKITFDKQVGITNIKKRTAKEVLWCNFVPNGQIDLFKE